MRERLQWRADAIPVGMGLVLATVLGAVPLGAQLDLWLSDRLSRVVAPTVQVDHSLIVTIDDASLTELEPLTGAWPYGRDVWAHVVDYLREAGASRTVVDVVFAEPRRGDEQLRAAIERTPGLLLTAVLAPEALTSDTERRRAVTGLGWRVPSGTPARSWVDITPPRPELMRAGGVAVASVLPDRDGVVRRLSLLHRLGDTILPPLPLAALSDPLPEVAWRPSLLGGVLQVGPRAFPTGAGGDVELWFSRTIERPRTIAFARLARAALTSVVDPELQQVIRGRHVFVGASAMLLDDAIQTPAGRVAGVDFVAVAEAMLRQGLTLRPRARAWDLLVLLAVVLVALRLSRERRATPAGLVMALPVAVLVLLTVALVLILVWQQRVGLVLPAVGAAGVVATVGLQEVMRLRQQQQQMQAERMAAERATQQKTQFLNHVAHELRTPVAAIVGFSRILSQDVRQSNTSQEYAQVIARNASHLLQLVNNLLDDARLSIGRAQTHPHPTSIRQILRDVLSTMEALPRVDDVELTAEVTAETPDRLLADDLRIRQVVLNLVGNAVKFTRAGHVRVHAGWQQGQLTVSVEDTGPGIAPEAQSRIFEDFEFGAPGAERAGGSGLGLSVSRRLARLMGGDVTVTSTVGVGSRFVFVVPARAVAGADTVAPRTLTVAPPAAAPAAPPARRREPTVLVCDDSEDIRQLFTLVLQQAGVRVVEAGDGDEAVACVEAQAPDLVLLDLDLPTVDGVRALALMREGGYMRPVIAVTGAGDEHTTAMLLARGFSDVVHKPMPVSRLVDLVSSHLPDWQA